MVARRSAGFVLVGTIIAALCCASMIGVGVSLVSDRFSLQRSMQAISVSSGEKPGAVLPKRRADAKKDGNQALQHLRAAAPDQEKAMPRAEGKRRGGEALAFAEEDSSSTIGSESETVDAFEEATTAGEQTPGTNEPEASQDEHSTTTNNSEANSQTPEPKASSETIKMELNPELMTPEFIQEIESQESDCLSPMHVHLLWIGDINKAPSQRHQYTQKGYNLTVHTSAEEILEGFHPYVAEAYKLAIPNVVGFDFLKFLMLYKYGGLAADADTTPSIQASALQFPSDCDVVFGKESRNDGWTKPEFLNAPRSAYAFDRPFQILNWAMAVNKPRNPHIKELIKGAMMHFFGRRDMEQTLIQDISGSGLMTDYVALLHEREGRSYVEVYRDESKYVPVQGLCLTDGYLHGKWIRHAFLNSWRPVGVH